MENLLTAILLGIIEGITEFLPISSTGHLILVEQFARLPEHFDAMFTVVIQVGAIFSVIVYFRRELIPVGKNNPINTKRILDIWKKIIIAVIPALIIGALIGKNIEEWLFHPEVVAFMLILGGLILILIENKHKSVTITTISDLSYRTALYIGFIQCIAMIPGTSRSAATIIGAMLLGSSRVVAAEFSFFLAIPTMLAASAYSLFMHANALKFSEWILLLVGLFTSFVVAMGVIAFFMNYIRKKDFKLFGYYRIILGILVILYFALMT